MSARIKPRRVGAEEAAARGIGNEKERKRKKRERQSRRPILGAEGAKAKRHAPIHERSFFEVADAVGVERDPVMPDRHLARHLRVHGIGIIQKRRAEEGKA